MFLVLIQWSSSFKALSSLRSRKWNIVKENIHCRLDKAVYLGSMHFAKMKPYSDALLDTLWCCVVASAQIIYSSVSTSLMLMSCQWWVKLVCVVETVSCELECGEDWWNWGAEDTSPALSSSTLLSHRSLQSNTHSNTQLSFIFLESCKNNIIDMNSSKSFPKKDSYYD